MHMGLPNGVPFAHIGPTVRFYLSAHKQTGFDMGTLGKLPRAFLFGGLNDK